jgi:hypothetical protein
MSGSTTTTSAELVRVTNALLGHLLKRHYSPLKLTIFELDSHHLGTIEPFVLLHTPFTTRSTCITAREGKQGLTWDEDKGLFFSCLAIITKLY